jgi:outer membrane lipoprotein-sorting protein
MRQAILLVAAGLVLTSLAESQESSDPWEILEGVRTSMVKAGPIVATFSMTYVPAGFSTGDSESGRLAIALPDCIRWDYQQPYPKSFLLCDGTVHAWNDEDKTGRRYRLDYNREPALSLLFVDVDFLKSYYTAIGRSVAGGLDISLAPKGRWVLRDAVLTVDLKSERITGVSYHDLEGNLTRFEINKYYGLSSKSLFSPPNGITWEDGR